jgi:acetoin utilization protein AcuA
MPTGVNILARNEKGPVEILVDPTAEIIQESTIARGLGLLYRYHPEARQRLAAGFLRFVQSVEGRLVLARSKKRLIVGYAVIEKPDPIERWGDPGAPELWELAFIEVARRWRQCGIGQKVLRACFADGGFDDRIVLATLYAWDWDLTGTRLSKATYRNILSRFLRSEGFAPFETDEPNIREDPANRLLVRIGPRVNPGVYTRFVALLHTGQGKSPPPEKASFLVQ